MTFIQGWLNRHHLWSLQSFGRGNSGTMSLYELVGISHPVFLHRAWPKICGPEGVLSFTLQASISLSPRMRWQKEAPSPIVLTATKPTEPAFGDLPRYTSQTKFNIYFVTSAPHVLNATCRCCQRIQAPFHLHLAPAMSRRRRAKIHALTPGRPGHFYTAICHLPSKGIHLRPTYSCVLFIQSPGCSEHRAGALETVVALAPHVIFPGLTLLKRLEESVLLHQKPKLSPQNITALIFPDPRLSLRVTHLDELHALRRDSIGSCNLH